MVLVQISMSVRGRPSASVRTASAQTDGADMIVSVAAICSTLVSTTLASVSLSFWYSSAGRGHYFVRIWFVMGWWERGAAGNSE